MVLMKLRCINISLKVSIKISNLIYIELFFFSFSLESNSNGLLKQLLSQNLNENEEFMLFEYLKSIKHPNLNNFKAIYFLQRSRYLDIVNDNVLGKKPENSGLHGLSNLTLDEIVSKLINNSLSYTSTYLKFPRTKKKSRLAAAKHVKEMPLR